MTGRGNNTYLIVSDGAAALIDAGVGDPQHLADITDALHARNAELQQVLVTHGHTDHASGAPALATHHPRASFLKCPWPEQDSRFAVEWRPLVDGDAVTIGDERVLVLHTPGHSPDHLAFWHEPSATVFAGDLVVAGSSVMIHASRGGNLTQYLASLERLLSLKPAALLPAHGLPPKYPSALLSSYLEHRAAREKQVVDALANGRTTVEAISEFIYDRLDPALMAAARENVRAHLDKLEAEGRVDRDEAGRWRLRG
jgi:glyoxylase-like metal-dependent hydrolase (beta-lactamase superfamily II)